MKTSLSDEKKSRQSELPTNIIINNTISPRVEKRMLELELARPSPISY